MEVATNNSSLIGSQEQIQQLLSLFQTQLKTDSPLTIPPSSQPLSFVNMVVYCSVLVQILLTVMLHPHILILPISRSLIVAL